MSTISSDPYLAQLLTVYSSWNYRASEEEVLRQIQAGDHQSFSLTSSRFDQQRLCLEALIRYCLAAPGMRAMGIAHKDSVDWIEVLSAWGANNLAIRYKVSRPAQAGWTKVTFETGIHPRTGRDGSTIWLANHAPGSAGSEYRGHRFGMIGLTDEQEFSPEDLQNVHTNAFSAFTEAEFQMEAVQSFEYPGDPRGTVFSFRAYRA